jgi:hypothetical protein
MQSQSDTAEWGMDAQALTEARVQIETLALARARSESRALARVRAATLPGTREAALALALAHALGALPGARGQVLEPEPMSKMLIHDEVLADSKLQDIIYSIKPGDLWRHPHIRHQYWWLIQIIAPIIRLPPELLQQIFLPIIEANNSPLVLMLVCKQWHTIITGIWASLKLGTTTPKDAVTRKLERNQWLLDVVVDTEIDRGDVNTSGGAYDAIFAAMEASSRWRSLVVETFPAQADLPEHLVNLGLQPCSNAVMSRLRTFRVKSAGETSPLLDRLLCILGTSASGDLTTVEINSAMVLSFLAPTYSSIFHSVKVLSLNTPGLPNSVDLLPHLYRLETLTASHLLLPIYPNDVELPFVRTLRLLKLRAVSIQWMSGRTFHVLESCTLLFPLHHLVPNTFNTTLPTCKDLTFQGYPLDILDGVSAHKLIQLSVMCPSTQKPRGSLQLVRLRESRLAPQILHIGIEATTQAWTKALDFMSNLEELVIDNARPSSLGVKVLQSFVVHPNNLSASTTPWARNKPLCPSLKRFGLRYRRWLRSSERFDLIPDLISIIWSRQQSNFSLQSFRIWTRGDQIDPLELIEGSWISFGGFERLANDSAIKGGNLFQLVVSRLVEYMFKPAGKSSTACPQM